MSVHRLMEAVLYMQEQPLLSEIDWSLTGIKLSKIKHLLTKSEFIVGFLILIS
jgi:hypothetical protein